MCNWSKLSQLPNKINFKNMYLIIISILGGGGFSLLLTGFL